MKVHTHWVFLFTFFVGISLLACVSPETPEPKEIPPILPDTLSFLALGDSYTIGQSVSEPMRWPNQLADTLKKTGLEMEMPRIIAQTGWTTGDLQRAIANAKELKESYDLVSLLIGVNNQFRGYEFSIYEEEFPKLLNKALELAGGDVNRVLVVSIPDYGVTPFGSNYNPQKIATELDQYNAFAQLKAEELDISFFDITPISREAKQQTELVARDGLHPSGLMYKRWVELMVDEVQAKLKE